MTAIRQAGKIGDHTTMIDLGMEGFRGITALYLLQGKKRCLVDGGTRSEAGRLIKALASLDAFPPDIIVVTHPHYDHSQAIPALRRMAAGQRKQIEVIAARDAIPLLADPSFNEVFDEGPYEAIEDVTPVDEGDSIDLGGITLRVYDAPGHCAGHIALLDEQSGNLYVGDSLGLKLGDQTALPPFMPPTWDHHAFRATVDRFRQVDYQALCLAHYGCIYGHEARTLLDEALVTCDLWWDLFNRHANRLDDPGFIASAVMDELKPGIPDLQPVSPPLVVMFPLLKAWYKAIGRGPEAIVSLLLKPLVKQLITGYRMSQGA